MTLLHTQALKLKEDNSVSIPRLLFLCLFFVDGKTIKINLSLSGILFFLISSKRLILSGIAQKYSSGVLICSGYCSNQVTAQMGITVYAVPLLHRKTPWTKGGDHSIISLWCFLCISNKHQFSFICDYQFYPNLQLQLY